MSGGRKGVGAVVGVSVAAARRLMLRQRGLA